VTELQLRCAPSALSAASRSRADEIGTGAAESTRQMDDGDGIGHVSPFPIPDPHGIGKMQSLSLSAEVNRNNLVAVGPLAGTGAAGLKATVLWQLIYIEHPKSPSKACYDRLRRTVWISRHE